MFLSIRLRGGAGSYRVWDRITCEDPAETMLEVGDPAKMFHTSITNTPWMAEQHADRICLAL